MKLFSQIIITEDLLQTAAWLSNLHKDYRCFILPANKELRAAKVEDIDELERLVMLKDSKERIIILCFKELPVLVQNKLLKLLEEPPAGVYFKLLSTSKNTLLDTVKSRLIMQNLKAPKNSEILNLNLAHLSDLEIAEFDCELETKEMIASLFATACAQKIKLNLATLELFNDCYELSALNINNKALIAKTLLLAIRKCCA